MLTVRPAKKNCPAPQDNLFLTVSKIFKYFSSPLLFGTSKTSDVQLSDIAAAMHADSNMTLTPGAARELVRSLVEQPAGATALRVKVSMGGMPVHFKRTMSELMGVSTALAWASTQGYFFFCPLSVFSKFWNPKAKNLVPPRWPDEKVLRPDYVLWTPKGKFIILESKGVSKAVGPLGSNFVDEKLQSLNVKPAFPVHRYFLCHVYQDPGDDLVLQWTNHRRMEQLPLEGTERYGLMIALTHFSNQLRNAGHEEEADDFLRVAPRGTSDIPAGREETRFQDEGEHPVEPQDYPHFRREAGFHFSRQAVHYKLVVADQAMELFREISGGEWLYDPDLARALTSRLNRLSPPLRRRKWIQALEQIPRVEQVEWMAPTGIGVVAMCEQ